MTTDGGIENESVVQPAYWEKYVLQRKYNSLLKFKKPKNIAGT